LKILILFLTLFFLFSIPAVAGSYESFDGSLLVASAQGKKNGQQPASGKVVIKGKGGKVTDVEQESDEKKKKKKNDNKDD